MVMTRGADFQAIERLLRPGERVLWVGRPDPRALLGVQDLFVIPFSLVWMALPTIGLGGAVLDGDYSGLPFLAVFLGVGLYLTVGRFLIGFWTRKRTIYAVTQRRAISIVRGQITSVDTGAWQPLTMRRGKRGRGSVAFGSAEIRRAPAGMGAFAGWGGAMTGVGLSGVRDFDALAAAVEKAVGD
jgi:hypothetical protein